MNLSYFKTFVHVAELESFSKAADAIKLTQPAVSFQVHALEKAYKEVFFDRSSQRIKLTDAGKIFYQYAKKILELDNELYEKLGELKDLVRGELKIGASNIPGEYILPRLVGEFKQLHPQVVIKIDVMDSKEVISKLLAHQLDIGFCGAVQKKVPLIYEEFAVDELAIAMRPDHPLTANEYVRITDIKKYPFVMREEGSGTRLTFKEAIEAKGLPESKLNIVLELGSTQAVLSAVAQGAGITPVSIYALVDHVKACSLTYRKVIGLNLKRKLYIAYNEKSPMSKAHNAFLEFIKAKTPEIEKLPVPSGARHRG